MSFAIGGRLRAELYIDTGHGDENVAALQALRAESDAVADELGQQPEWEELEGKRACRIACYRDGTIDDAEEKLEEYRAWAVDQLLRFKRVFGGRLRRVSLAT